MRQHENEEEVKKAVKLAPKSGNRKAIWTMLTRKGDHEHNIASLKNNVNDLVIVRKVNDDSEIDFIPCTYCKGFFLAKYLRQHDKRCLLKNDNGKTSCSVRSSRVLLSAEISSGRYQDVHELILSKMKRDSLAIIIRNDDLLLLYSAVLIQKKEKERYHDIRYGLRLLARTFGTIP